MAIRAGAVVQFAVSKLLDLRHVVVATGARFNNRRFVFALAALAILAAKIIHIYSHISALTGRDLKKWGYSFFMQDVLLLMIIRFLLDKRLFPPRGHRFVQLAATSLAYSFIAFIITLSIINISFFVVSGSEIHWRNVGVAGDAAGRALVLSGLISSIIVVCVLVFLSWALQNVLFAAVGLLTDAISLILAYATRGWVCGAQFQSPRTKYQQVAQSDMESAFKADEFQEQEPASLNRIHLLLYAVVMVGLLVQITQSIVRPHDRSLVFMSWTPALLPFVDLKNSAPNLESVHTNFDSGINHEWDTVSALGKPIPLPWLPESPIDGFEDWYEENGVHYNASMDPLKISNLDEPLRSDLGDLSDVPIRHIITIVLESTRKDVFPIKEDGINVQHLRDSLSKKKFSGDQLKRLETLTPVARFVTGDLDDGFNHTGETQKKRGGMNFNDAYTTSTFTLKSLTGSLCGIMPMTADFNLEYLHHMYQPCLPHILGALNTLDHEDQGSHDFGGYKWASTFMQTATLTYDHFESLMKKIGFPKSGLIDKEYLIKDTAKFGKVELEDVNYFGFEETPLEDYIRDEFRKADKDDGRVFLTHVTSTSHHPYNMPKNETYISLGDGLDDLSKYINTIGYDDRWLGTILDTLDDLGVANETLVIFVGDHGLSIPENNVLATYYNPHIVNNHVPLVFSHPKLPPITIDDAISTQQILPTILDLLIETGSLSGSAANAAKDLLHNYEGQSLLRPTLKASPESEGREEVGYWQFTNINPGRAMLGMRDARHNSWRIVVPVVDNQEWQFFDTDNPDLESVVGFEFSEYQKKIEEVHGEAPAKWVEEAAFMARWFVDENSKRWRFGPYEED